MECIYDRNLRAVQLAISGRTKRVMRIEPYPTDTKLDAIWANCLMILRSIKPCQCEECRTELTFRAIEGRDDENLTTPWDKIARVGWENWNADERDWEK